MPKLPPILDLVALHATAGNDLVALPAVSVVAAGGFLSSAFPVARVGNRKRWVTMLLVPHSDRSSFARNYNDYRQKEDRNAQPFSETPIAWVRCPGQELSDGFPAARGANGKPMRAWYNAENCWVVAAFLVAFGEAMPADAVCHTTSMLMRCAKLAIELCGGEAGP